jgi:replication-associated recombination protein RarA
MTPPKTRNGYDLYELLSALQKDIRRGNEEQALRWASELDTIFSTALWNRLKVISLEDIGPANPMMVPIVTSLYELYVEFKTKENGAYHMALTNCIMIMCRSLKSREAEETTCIFNREADSPTFPPPQIPEYALDKHTARGKAMGKSIEDFYEEAIKIYPTNFPPVVGRPSYYSPYTERAKKSDYQKYGLAQKYEKEVEEIKETSKQLKLG